MLDSCFHPRSGKAFLVSFDIVVSSGGSHATTRHVCPLLVSMERTFMKCTQANRPNGGHVRLRN